MESTVTGGADDPVQRDGIEPQLVAAPDQIAFRRYLDHVSGQEHFPAM